MTLARKASKNENSSEEILYNYCGASTLESADIVRMKRGKKTNNVTLIKKTKYNKKC